MRRLGTWWAGATRSDPDRRRLHLAVLVVTLGVGATLRLGALAALPDFFGEGDPAIYYTMAHRSLHEGVPRVDFVWQYGSLPERVRHVEDYYEPAFGYVLAGALAAFGDRPFSARMLLALLGCAVPLAVYVVSRRLGRWVALVAAAIVALEPWSIYYSGTLMKESLAALTIVVLAEWGRRALESPPRSRAGVTLGGAVLVGSLFQYELLPILAVAGAVTLAVHRRDLLAGFVATTALGGVALGGVAWWALGVPLSAKFAFFTGRHLWSPLVPFRGTPQRFLPFGYVLGMLLLRYYPMFLAMAWQGAGDLRRSRPERTWALAVTLAFLYFHGVPHDLWERDFIPLTALLAPFVASAIARPALWAASPGRSALALGAIAGAWFGPEPALQLHRAGIFPVTAMPWTVIASSALLIALFVALFRLTWRSHVPAPVAWMLPAILGVTILAAFARGLPWSHIPDNPQFPGYTQRLATLEQACVRLRRSYPGATVMTSSPSEVSLYAGCATVLLPRGRDPRAIVAASQRYGTDVAFVRRGEILTRTAAAAGLVPVERFLGHEVWAFPSGGRTAPASDRRP